MIEDDFISIVIPVYNVHEYLFRCVESILNQTYRNFEIILVDDGSTDGSGEICDKLVEKDSRVKVIHKENGGVSTARNTGLSILSGKFVTFVDSDDTVNPRFVEEMHAAFDESVDMVVCAYNCVDETGKVQPVNSNQDCSAVFSREDAIGTMLYGKLFAGHCWNKMFRKSKLDNLIFCSDIAVYEDLLFCLEYLLKSTKIKYIPSLLYNYYNRQDSALHGKMSPAKLTAFKALEIIESKLQGIYGDKYKELIDYDKTIWILDCYRILYYNKKNRSVYHPYLKSKLNGIKGNRYLSRKAKCKLLLILINPTFYYWTCFICGKR